MERKPRTIRLGLVLCTLILASPPARSQSETKKMYEDSNKKLAQLLKDATKAREVAMEGPISFGLGVPKELRNCWCFRSNPLDRKVKHMVERYINADSGDNILRLVDGEFTQVGALVKCGKEMKSEHIEQLLKPLRSRR